MINRAVLIPFFTGKFGGPYYVIKELIPYLATLGVKTSIYTTSNISQKGKKRTEFFERESKNLLIYRFNSYLRFREYRISFSLIPHLLKNIKNIDIIHSNAIRIFQEDVSSLISLAKKKPFIITPHGGININYDYGDKIPKMLHDKMFGYMIRKLLKPHFIAVAKNEIPVIKKLGVDDNHIHYIPNGINTELFKPVDSSDLKKKYNLENYDVILYVGRIAKGKGLDKLLKILKFIINNKNTVKLVIVGGDSGYLPVVKNLIQKYKLSRNVIITGFITKNILPKYYSMADLVIHPSKQEIFSLVICEASACSKPVIGSNIMGPSEIIKDSITGYTTNFEDLKKLSYKIINLLEDKKLLEKLGKNARERVQKKYSWLKTAELHLQLFRKVLNYR